MNVSPSYISARTKEDVLSSKTEILLAISRTEEMLLGQFQDVTKAARIKRQLDSDITSIYDYP